MEYYFSLSYGGERRRFPIRNGAVYELDAFVTAEVSLDEYPELGASRWVIHFENRGTENSAILSDVLDCDTVLPLTYPREPRHGYMPKAGDACVIAMCGMVDGAYYWENDRVSAREFSLMPEYLDKARGQHKHFANVGARSSEGTMPFFDVTANGEGYIAAIGWTGDWRADFTKGEQGILMQSGLKETAFYLCPGERLRTSSVLIMHYRAGEDQYNRFRSLIRRHFSHAACTGAQRESLLATELWGGLPSAEMKRRLVELKAHGVRFEDIWIDAGWYGECTKCDDAFSGDWWKHTGTWEVNRRVHPEGLRDVAATAEDAGMGIMLWLEPERAIRETRLLSEHPEWFFKSANADFSILNYGNEEAVDAIADLIGGYIEDLGMSCYRQDFNTQLTEVFRQNDSEGRRGISEIKHITGMYRLWDTLLERYPHLLIDNCASGGRRIDIETLCRSIPFFRSDYQCNFNENSDVLQVHNAGACLYLPYVGCTTKTKGDTYAARSSYASSWGGAFYNAVFQSMSEEDFAWARSVTEEYRRIRRYFSLDFYNHGSSTLDSTAWAIWQYHDPETRSGIVMAFRRGDSPFESVTIRLGGLADGTPLSVECLDNGEIADADSALTLSLPERRSSTILLYRAT